MVGQCCPVIQGQYFEGRHKGNGGFRESHSKKSQKRPRTKKLVDTQQMTQWNWKGLFCLIDYLVCLTYLPPTNITQHNVRYYVAMLLCTTYNQFQLYL